MSDYTQSTDFSAKDSLITGDPNKVIYGADIDTELGLISTAIASKVDNSAGTLSTLATNDKVFVYDTSASVYKTITSQELWDQEAYLSTTATATTSGSSKEITGIPSNAKQIIIPLSAISSNTATDALFLQIASSSSYDITGYTGTSWDTNSGVSGAWSGYAYEVLPYMGLGTQSYTGTITLTRLETTNHIWICSSSVSASAGGYITFCNGRKSLAAALDRVKISISGTFDSGAFNILVRI